MVLTNDLDFGTRPAAGGGASPSVIQVGALDLLPAVTGPAVLAVIREHGALLATGALVSLDETNARVRILPIRRTPR